MRTVSSCVTDKEYAVIVEFANQYGETVSSAIKKAIFNVAALTYEGKVPAGYVLQTESREGKDEDGHSLNDILFVNNVDKIRQIVGWPELNLWGYKREKEGKSIGTKGLNEQPTPADEESSLLNAIAKRIREEQAEKKKPTLEGCAAWLRSNKRFENSSG